MDVYNVFSFQFIFYFILFWVSLFITFYLPGRVMLFLSGKTISSNMLESLLATVIGLVMWGFQAYVFGYVQIRWLTYGYIILFIIIALTHRAYFRLPGFSTVYSLVKKNIIAVLLICTGTAVQAFQVFGSGLMYTDGMKFFGVNNIDGVMHLAYIRSIIRDFPPLEPGSYGSALVNYHYWSDMIIGDLVRIWNLPVHHTFFQFFPIFIALFSGLAAYYIVQVWGWGKRAGYLSIFFLYFAGDATYLLILFLQQKLNFATPAIDNGATQFFNMPTALAKLVFLTGLITFEYWIQKKKMYWGFITVMLFASLVGIKVYFGIFAIFGFVLVTVSLGIVKIVRTLRKGFTTTSLNQLVRQLRPCLLLNLLLVLITSLIYLPANRNSGGLGYYPMEWPRIFLGTEILDIEGWFLRMQVYEEAKNYRNIFILNAFAILVSLIAIHGTRLIGIVPSRSLYRKLGWEKLVFFLPGILVFHILGFTTLQKSGGLNVFNFFVVSTVVMSLFAALLISDYLKRKTIIRFGIVFLIVIITIPRVIFETYHMATNYLSLREDSTVISRAELEGLDFIKRNTPVSGVVQSHPENSYDRRTPYVSYFTDRSTYISGERLQMTHNKNVDQRVKDHLVVFEAENTQEFVNRAKQHNMEIIYIQKKPEQQFKFNPDNNLLEKIFENSYVVIYRLTGR